MHLTTARVIVLVAIGVIAAITKIVSTVKVSHNLVVPKPARIVFVLRTILLFVLVALALARFFLPPVWQFSFLGMRTFIALIGLLVIFWLAYVFLIWKGRKTVLQKHDVAGIR